MVIMTHYKVIKYWEKYIYFMFYFVNTLLLAVIYLKYLEEKNTDAKNIVYVWFLHCFVK